MLARITTYVPKTEKKEELVTLLKKEVLPMLKKQNGFLEILPLIPETKTEKFMTITLWTDRKDVERYEMNTLPKIEEVLKPYLLGTMTTTEYVVETTLCEHFVAALVA
ncbi:MAG TPA: antibiotic biosynthesis monooxygenase [Terriglobales bacterium]